MNNDVTTLGQLESHLWEAANILRGPVDAADFKTYVFPLLFFKRISDVHDEEYAAALAESGGDAEFAAYPENHRFQIPPEAHWREVRQVARNVGQALQSSLCAIETANPDKLYGIFGDAQWTNKDRLSDAMLLSAVAHLRRQGQERNLMTSSIARINCFLHGIEDFQILRGDTLESCAKEDCGRV